MKIAGMGKFLSMLYDDQFDVYRTEKDLNPDQTTDIFYMQEPKYSNVPGRISFVSDDRGSDTAVDATPIQYDPKLFCAPDVDIKAGDYIVLRRLDDQGNVTHTYKGRAAKPSWYTTHQEVFIRVNEEA